MSSSQYDIFCKDYDRHNALQWLCDSCKEQNKEITQREMPITWGKMKDLTLAMAICKKMASCNFYLNTWKQMKFQRNCNDKKAQLPDVW